jgi:hypothetical protein
MAVNILPLLAKVPQLVATASRTVSERKSMEDIMRGALSRAICPEDPNNPAVARLAGRVNERLWERRRDGRGQPGRWQRTVGWVRRKLRKADPEVVDWLRWREEMKAWPRRHVTDAELHQTLQLADCTVDGASSAHAFMEALPEAFVEELHADATPLRLSLRDRVSRADAARRSWVLSRLVRRFGSEGVAGILGTSGALELAHLLDLDTIEQTSLAAFAALISAAGTRRYVQSRRREKLVELVGRWIPRCLSTFDKTQGERASLLSYVEGVLLARAEKLEDDLLILALEDVQDALIEFGEGSGREAVVEGLRRVAALLDLPL